MSMGEDCLLRTDIKIIPLSQRAKNRVKEHGEIMELITISNDKILVKSLNKTWNNNTDHWSGWFTNKEAQFTKEY